MKWSLWSGCMACCLAVGSLLLSGCGMDSGKGATVKGKIVLKGAPLPIKPVMEGAPPDMVDTTVALTLQPKGGAAQHSEADKDGNFQFNAVPPGTYTLGVTHMPRPGGVGGAGLGPGGPGGGGPGGAGGPGDAGGGEDQRKEMEKKMAGQLDKLGGKFAAVNSQITVTIPEGQSVVDLGTIDLEDKSTWPK